MELAPKHTGLSVPRLERITEHLERRYIGSGKIAGAQVAVARHGRLAYLRSFGQMDRERGRPMAEDAIFRIYSMTKPITSVALMSLWERGEFQLDDPVSRFFPAWADQRVWTSGSGVLMNSVEPAQPMTVRHLLSHTAGLTYGGGLSALGAPMSLDPVERIWADLGMTRNRDEPLSVFVDKLAKAPLRFQPGERWMYSYATDVCGALVERISGQRFDRFLEETIFGPLGMRDTAFFVPDDKASRFAAAYTRGPDKKLMLQDDPATSPYRTEPAFFSGGGGLVGTTEDYLRFCEMLRRGGELDGARILGPRTIELMRRNHLKDGQDIASLTVDGIVDGPQTGVGFGLGFAMTLDPVKADTPNVGDYYWGGAASTLFWIDPAEDLVVVFMTQLLPSRIFNFRGQLKSLVYAAIVE
ncbi:MAG: beta-lactamase family protein [Caulobacteraceae bacterium]|nr:beta-lactamase family protein [Caulobacteraceae bacterium]